MGRSRSTGPSRSTGTSPCGSCRLKIDDPELAVRVATGIVGLTQVKEAENKGWGYAYLKQWLPDNFGIKCGKQAKQAAVFKSLVDLRILRVLSKGKKGRATRWALGSRVWHGLMEMTCRMKPLGDRSQC